MSIPLFFGNSTGNTENVAEKISEKFQTLTVQKLSS